MQGILIVHTGANGETAIYLTSHSGLTKVTDRGIVGTVGKDNGSDVWVDPGSGTYTFQWLCLHPNRL